MKAIVKEIQVGGGLCFKNLEDACKCYTDMLKQEVARTKMLFAIELPSGEVKQITIRDEDGETVAYGDFEGLPSFLDYSKTVLMENSHG
jgi:hypothetical protein